MNRSYSKIRHIQEANLKLETRLLNEKFNNQDDRVISEQVTPSTNQEYVVKPGDSLSKIGRNLGVNWKEIATLNNIKNVNLIRVGQKLKIPGKTQTKDAGQTNPAGQTTNPATVQTDVVSAYGPDVESVVNQLFTKMPSFKTFGKYVDKVGMSKGIDMTAIGTNLTVDEIKQKYPTELVDMPTSGFKFYTATEGRPFTKDTYNVLTPIGRPYVRYLNDVTSTPESQEELYNNTRYNPNKPTDTPVTPSKNDNVTSTPENKTVTSTGTSATSNKKPEWCNANIDKTKAQICIIKSPFGNDNKNAQMNCQKQTGYEARSKGYINMVKIDVNEPNFCKTIWEKIQ